VTGSDRPEDRTDEPSMSRGPDPAVDGYERVDVPSSDRLESIDDPTAPTDSTASTGDPQPIADSPPADSPPADSPPADLPAPDPSAVLGRVPTGTTLRTELAAAARSRGMTASIAAKMSTLHESIESIEIPSVDLERARKRLAEATGEEERLKERVAAKRGNVQGRRAVDADPSESLADLEDAAAALSAAQTERVAAEQALERARERAAAARDERERRLALRDRLENRRRDARSELANETYPVFCEALSAVPDGDRAMPGDGPSAYDGPSIAGSFAVVRISEIDGPVVLGPDAVPAFDRWNGPPAETVLGVPVVRPDD